MHIGHVDFLQVCRQFGHLTVGVNTDEFVETFKPKPIMSLNERKYALNQLGLDTVDNASPGKELIEMMKPDVLVVGSDWARKNYYKQIDVTQNWLDDHQIILAYVPYVQHFPMSSTEIKRRVKDA